MVAYTEHDTWIAPVLFRDGQDRRQSGRVPMTLKVRLGPPREKPVTTLMSEDVSEGGLFVRCSQEVQVGARFSVEVSTPSGERIYVPEAEVLYNVQDGAVGKRGFGARFVSVTPEARDKLLALARFEGVPIEPPRTADLPLMPPGRHVDSTLELSRAGHETRRVSSSMIVEAAQDGDAREIDAALDAALDPERPRVSDLRLATLRPTQAAALVEARVEQAAARSDVQAGPARPTPSATPSATSGALPSSVDTVPSLEPMPANDTLLESWSRKDGAKGSSLEAAGSAIELAEEAPSVVTRGPSKARSPALWIGAALVFVATAIGVGQLRERGEVRAADRVGERPVITRPTASPSPTPRIGDGRVSAETQRALVAGEAADPERVARAVVAEGAPKVDESAAREAEARQAAARAAEQRAADEAAVKKAADEAAVRAAEAKKAEDAKRADDAKKADDARRADDAKKADDAKRAADTKKAEATKLAAAPKPAEASLDAALERLTGTRTMVLGLEPGARVLKTFSMSNPSRFVVDVAGQPGAPKVLEASAELTAPRYGRHDGYLRLVFDVRQPPKSMKADVVDGRLVVELGF